MNRQARRASTRHTATPATDRTKDRATNIIAGVVFSILGLIVLAFLMIPVTWALVHGYRWAIG